MMGTDKMKGSGLKKALGFAKERLEQARTDLAATGAHGQMDEYQTAQAAVLHLERKLAAERGEGFAETTEKIGQYFDMDATITG